MSPALNAPEKANILFLDAYDSFSNNIISQVEQCLDADVHRTYIDHPAFYTHLRDLENGRKPVAESSFFRFLKSFDAVIAGPGPGWASTPEDVGLIAALWKLHDEDLLPVLGICLGFQSLCLAFGGESIKLREPKHGIIHEILHNGQSMFSNVGRLQATQYHSLQIDIGHPIQTKGAVSYPGQLWEPTEKCPHLEPLAWDFESKENQAVLMGVRHTEKPFWGVQFHPESICTNEEGAQMIKSWWECAQAWRRRRQVTTWGRKPSWPLAATPSIGTVRHFLERKPGASRYEEDADRLKEFWEEQDEQKATADLGSQIGPHAVLHGENRYGVNGDRKQSHHDPKASMRLDFMPHLEKVPHLHSENVQCSTTGSGRLTVPDVCEAFDIAQGEAIVLESGLKPNLTPMGVGTGRYSIIGLVEAGETFRLQYNLDINGRSKLQLRDGNDKVVYETCTNDPWFFIQAFMDAAKPAQAPPGPTYSPFWGGLMGYVSYEAGLETIHVKPTTNARHPDIIFAYVTRSVVIDHQVKKVYIQSLRADDDHWIERAREKVHHAAFSKSQASTPIPTPQSKPNPFDTDAMMDSYINSIRTINPVEPYEYCMRVKECQDYIANGHSYELCLTTQHRTEAKRPPLSIFSQPEDNELSWKLYKRMTGRNPAPFSAYVRLHNVHILSSSPERYISWDRNQRAQCRPIKGTVKKDAGVTAKHAHAILSSSKERAENLMIVDLVRHQLHGVYGSGNVHVTRLMQVEEYETLWQLVTVVDAIPPSLHIQYPELQLPSQGNGHEEAAAAESNGPPPHNMDLDDETRGMGFSAFVQSLPPGSMTGAPKKRSCEILLNEEKDRRGIYSGVLGYLDVGGAGDFSVIIRTAVKIDSAPCLSSEPEDAPQESDVDVWQIGAGGAITAQSEPSSEFDEMMAKYESASRAFLSDDAWRRRQPLAPQSLLKTDAEAARGLMDLFAQAMEADANGDGALLAGFERQPDIMLALQDLISVGPGGEEGLVATVGGEQGWRVTFERTEEGEGEGEGDGAED